MNSNSPNLFHYATKELSQDAMICWLIDWAGQTEGDEELRRCGLRFVNALLNHKRDDKIPIEVKGGSEIKIVRQERSIDVLVRINQQHVLLIEDKTDTKDHSEQLSRYYDDVVEGRTQFGKVRKRDLRPVYFKTGNQSLSDDRRIEEIENYKVFNRQDFLNVLDGCMGSNQIVMDFRQYLQGVEDETKSYSDWTGEARRESWWAWQGFFRHLECKLHLRPGMGNWEYVSNPSGGFLGFWWWLSENDQLYLQIEAQLRHGQATRAKLCFKVDTENKSNDRKQALKWRWHERVLAAGRTRVKKPRVMRIGNTMTVAWWTDDWMAFGKDGKLDMSGTVENLKRAKTVLKSAISSS